MLKFITKNVNKIISFVETIHKLLTNNKVEVRGLYLKGEHTILIEVLMSSFFETWLSTLVEDRNNVRTLSDKAKKDILKNVFGKFSFVMLNEIVYMNVVPNIDEKFVDCKASYYPFGLCNGNVINVKANGLKEHPELIMTNIINELLNGDKLLKIFGSRIECSAISEYSVRFIIKTQNITDNLVKSLSAVFGSLSFCSSTLHLIPKIQSSKFTNTMNSSLNAKQTWSALSEIDVLFCNSNEQALAMKRKNQSLKNSPSNKTNCNKITGSSSSQKSISIFNRLGPRISARRPHASSEQQPTASSYSNLRITAHFNTSSSFSSKASKSRSRR